MLNLSDGENGHGLRNGRALDHPEKRSDVDRDRESVKIIREDVRGQDPGQENGDAIEKGNEIGGTVR